MSDVQKIVVRLRELAERIPSMESSYPLSQPTFGAGCSEREVLALQKAIGAPLPDDYREYLSSCGRIDAADVFNGYFVYAPHDVARLHASGEVPGLIRYSEGAIVIESRVIAVGGDGGGNQFLLSTTAPWVGRMWKFDHEAGFADGVAGQGIRAIAETFSGFLERVATDWERFIEDDQEWEFLSG